MKKIFCQITLLFFLLSATCFSYSDNHERFEKLTETLRCLVCQNQSLADSDAPLAQDLRNIIQVQLTQGKSDTQILAFLTDRYGEFISFKPSFSKKNILLWLGPMILLVLGFICLATNIMKHNHRDQQKTNLSAEEKMSLEQLLK